MFGGTGNHPVCVYFTVPEIMSIVWFSCASNFLQCALLAHSDEQYSATLYTNDNTKVRSTLILHPRLVANLAMMLLRVFILFLMLCRC